MTQETQKRPALKNHKQMEENMLGRSLFFFFKINVEREYVGLVGHVATKTVIT